MKNNDFDLLASMATKYSDYNPGALTFFCEAIKHEPQKSLTAFDRMLFNGIKGSKLYMLWNDCCDRNTEKTLDIMMNNSIDDINKHINYENGRGIEYD